MRALARSDHKLWEVAEEHDLLRALGPQYSSRLKHLDSNSEIDTIKLELTSPILFIQLKNYSGVELTKLSYNPIQKLNIIEN